MFPGASLFSLPVYVHTSEEQTQRKVPSALIKEYYLLMLSLFQK